MDYRSFLNPFSVDVSPQMVSANATPAIVELGSSVASVVLRWEFNRDLTGLVVNGTTLPNNTTVQTITGPFQTDQTWTLKGSASGKNAVGKAALSFQNKAYWGTGTTAPTNSADILTLPSKSFVTTKTKTSLGYSCYDGKFPIYCFPSRLGVPTTIKVSEQVPYTRGQTRFVSFTGFTASTVQFTNLSGFSEAYTVLIFTTLPAQAFFSVRWT